MSFNKFANLVNLHKYFIIYFHSYVLKLGGFQNYHIIRISPQSYIIFNGEYLKYPRNVLLETPLPGNSQDCTKYGPVNVLFPHSK